MSFIEIYLIGLAVILGFMTMLWLVSLILRDSSIVDIFWGSGFILAAGVYAGLAEGFDGRKQLILILIIIWGLRLGLHIAWRNWGKGEDFRYANWREQYGASYWWVSYLRVFLLQGVILWIVSAPLLMAQYSETSDRLIWLDWLGMVVWGIGIFFEAVGDWQLLRFKVNPANKGKVLDTGVWRYTRHPNYFGDATLWWGCFLIALATPNGWLTIFSPILMTYLLLRVSGVAMLEHTLTDTKPAYRDYVRRTSSFFPLPPKK